MKVAYLASNITLPGAQDRRSDAFEHDQMMACLKTAFEANSARIIDLAWDDKNVDWKGFDAAIIGTAWDYPDRHSEFLETLDAIAGATRLFNSPAMVRWNSRKTYLRELEDKGVAIIPTLWFDDATKDNVRAAFDRLETDQLVLKRQIGASAEGQHRLRRNDAVPEIAEPMMAQPFLGSILDEGEISFVFVGGALSHTVIKKPADQDYRIQATYGGTESALSPSQDDVSDAANVISTLSETPLYARVDMLRGDDGKLQLMELELVEPFLYPQQGPTLGPRIYEAVKARL